MSISTDCPLRYEILIYEPLKNFHERAEEIAETLRTAPEHRSIFLDIISRIDVSEVEKFQEKYASVLRNFNPISLYKYADLPFWISDKINIAINLGLHRCKAKSILDIGMGGGHFAMVCEALGHKVIGTDKSVPLYNDVCRIFRLDRRFVSTEIRTPMPDFGVKFDVVAVIWPIFNIIKPMLKDNVQYWTPNDWKFFLKDIVTNHLKYPGMIFLYLNPNVVRSGTAIDKVLLKWTRDHGATADEVTNRVLFSDIHGWGTLEDAARHNELTTLD